MWDHRASKDLDHTRRAAFLGPFYKVCLFVCHHLLLYFRRVLHCCFVLKHQKCFRWNFTQLSISEKVKRYGLIVRFWVDSPFKPWLKTLMFNSLTFSSVNERMSTQEAGLVGQLATTLIQTLLCICINTSSSSSSSSSYCLLYIAPSHISKQF